MTHAKLLKISLSLCGVLLLTDDGRPGSASTVVRSAQIERYLRADYNYEVVWRTAHSALLDEIRRADIVPTLAAVIERRLAQRAAKNAEAPKPVEERLILVFPLDNKPFYSADNILLRRQGQGIIEDLQTVPTDGKYRVEIGRVGREILHFIEEDKNFAKGNLTEAFSLLLESMFEALHQTRLDAPEKILIREKAHRFFTDKNILNNYSLPTLTDFYDRCIVVGGLIRQTDFIGRTGRDDTAGVARRLAETTQTFLSPPKPPPPAATPGTRTPKTNPRP